MLGHEDQKSCEVSFLKKECLEAVKSMISDKTPCTDGLPAEFYEIFWEDISSMLVSALNYAFESGCLSLTQRRGIIKLIPKKDAELYFIKNWRPITLLDTDYKIAAKAHTNRINSVLPSLIKRSNRVHEEQIYRRKCPADRLHHRMRRREKHSRAINFYRL